MAHVLVFSGSGPYADQWHPFAETSACVADVLRGAGHDVVVRDSEPGCLLDVDSFDLVVVNSGGRTTEPDPAVTAAWDPDHRALGLFHDGGGPILGLHTAVATFPDWSQWTAIIGGRWGERSGHPAIDTATFGPAAGVMRHPVWEGLESVVTFDERYSHLEVAASSMALVQHETDGILHTMGWLGRGTVLYDGLGHDVRSYESAERRRLLANEVRWLLAPCRPAGH